MIKALYYLLIKVLFRIKRLYETRGERNLVRRDKLLKYARGRVWQIGSEEQLDYSAPTVFGGKTPVWMHEFARPFTIDAPFVCEVSDAELVGDSAVGVLKGNKIIVEMTQFCSVSKKELSSLRFKAHSPIEPRFEVACSLVDDVSGSYFHWVLERLTLLEGCEFYCNHTGAKPLLIVPKLFRPFQRDSLNLLGYAERDFFCWDAKPTNIKRLVVPSVRRYSENKSAPYDCMSPSACRWLRGRILSNFEKSPDSVRGLRRVYISRHKANSRRIVNEREFVSLLESFGFERYCLEDMAFGEQVALFSKANVVIGPHGAGLTNILWATPQTHVIELIPVNFPKPDYYQLSRALGFSYTALICRETNQVHDLIIDFKNLAECLDSVLRKPRP